MQQILGEVAGLQRPGMTLHRIHAVGQPEIPCRPISSSRQGGEASQRASTDAGGRSAMPDAWPFAHLGLRTMRPMADRRQRIGSRARGGRLHSRAQRTDGANDCGPLSESGRSGVRCTLNARTRFSGDSRNSPSSRLERRRRAARRPRSAGHQQPAVAVGLADIVHHACLVDAGAQCLVQHEHPASRRVRREPRPCLGPLLAARNS